MLLILAFSLVIASVFLIIYRKNKDSIYGWDFVQVLCWNYVVLCFLLQKKVAFHRKY